MWKYFIPGCVGRGLDLDLRVCPSSSPASGNLGCPLFGIDVGKQGFQTAWDITGQKFQGVGLRLKAFISTFWDLASHLCEIMSNNHESGWLGRFEVGELLPDLGLFETNLFRGILTCYGGHLLSKTYISQQKMFCPCKFGSY